MCLLFTVLLLPQLVVMAGTREQLQEATSLVPEATVSMLSYSSVRNGRLEMDDGFSGDQCMVFGSMF